MNKVGTTEKTEPNFYTRADKTQVILKTEEFSTKRLMTDIPDWFAAILLFTRE